MRRTFRLGPLAPESVFDMVGEGARRLVERALGPERAELVDEGVARFLAYYREHLLDATRFYPGVEDALSALRDAGVALSVLTNKPADLSHAILAGLGATDRFVAVIGGDSLPTRKPDPAGLHRLRALTATPRERTLLVGDSRVDVDTATAAGVSFCGVGWGLDPATLRAARPERMIAAPGELRQVVAGR